MTHNTLPWRAAALGALILLAAVTVSAVPPSRFDLGLTNYAPPDVPAAKLSLEEAVALAIQHDPNVYRAREETTLQRGLLRQSTGLFDTAFQVDLSYQLNISELSEDQRKTEANKRTAARLVAETLQTIADDLRRQLEESDGLVFANCPPGLILVVAGQTICVSPEQQANIQLTSDLAGALGLDQTQADLVDYGRSVAMTNLSLLDDAAFQVREGLRKLGQVPDYQDVTTIALNLGIQKSFRSGILIRPGLVFDSVQDIYRGKRQEAEWGGKGKPDTTRSEVNFRLDVPLGKGRGKVSAGAPERAAGFSYEASRRQQAHTVSETVLRTSLAYWNVVAAQERLALLQRSVRVNEEIYQIGRGLLDAGEIVASDLSQSRARVSETMAQESQARQSLVTAQVALAEAIGLLVKRFEDAPTVTGGWPDLPAQDELAALEPAELTALALTRRADAAAARLRQDAAQVLARAAKADLKARADLSMTVAYRALEEGNTINSPSGLFDHWGNALFGWYPGPSGKLSFSFEWPFGNNFARGRFEEAQSLHFQSAIRRTDLERVIGANVERLVGSLLDAAREVSERTVAARYYEELVRSQVEKWRLGESTVFDVILTEQDQISQLVALVGARQSLASLESQLRFETGSILSYRAEEDGVVIEEVQPAGLGFGP